MDQLIAGDEFSMGFDRPVNAFGMFFITSDPMWAGDIELQTDAGSVTPDVIEGALLPDGGLTYFFGMTSTDAFSSVDLIFNPDAAEAFIYSVDDITTASAAVPLPGGIWLLGSGLAGLVGLKHRKK
jgi:hypothetical protein